MLVSLEVLNSKASSLCRVTYDGISDVAHHLDYCNSELPVTWCTNRHHPTMLSNTHTHTCKACPIGISLVGVCVCVWFVHKMGRLCMCVRVYKMGILGVCVCKMGILVRLHTNQLWKHINRGYSQLTYTLNRGYPQLTYTLNDGHGFALNKGVTGSLLPCVCECVCVCGLCIKWGDCVCVCVCIKWGYWVCVYVNWGYWYDYTLTNCENTSTVDIPS